MQINLHTPEFYKQCKDFLIDIDRLHLLKNGYTLVELAMEYHKFIEKQVKETSYCSKEIISVFRKFPTYSSRQIESLLKMSMKTGMSPVAMLCFHNQKPVTISKDLINQSINSLENFNKHIKGFKK